MLNISTKQKKMLKNLSGGRQGKWTASNAVKAIHVIYGDKVSFIKFIGKFHGNNTKAETKCNMCGKIRCATLRSILYHPTCPRCHFKHDCSRLSYPIIQERLIKKNRPILIFPFPGHPYKNNTTKFMAYDYEHDETWVTCASRLSEGKGAPNYHHKVGFMKESKKLPYYTKKIKSMFKGKLHISLAEHYHGDKTRVHVIDDINNRKYDTTITNLVNPDKHLHMRLKTEKLPYYLKLVKKNFNGKLKIKHMSKFIGVYTTIKGINLLNNKSFDTTFGNLLLNTHKEPLPDKLINLIYHFGNKYGKKGRDIKSQISRAKFGYGYDHQHNVFIPHIKNIMKNYDTNMKIKTFGLKDNYGHNPKHPWYTTPYYINKSWNTPSANRKPRDLKRLNDGLKSFKKWYKSQDKITIPNFNKIVKHYHGNRMVVHCICNDCGYGKHGEWAENINKLVNGVSCPKCSHVLPISIKKAKHLIKKLYHGVVTVSFPKGVGSKIMRKQRVSAINHKFKKSWHTTVYNLLIGHGYMYESVSKGEKATGKKLRALGFIHQKDNKKLPANNHYVYGYVFKHLKYHENLHADFIVNINGHYIVIEYDGWQHFNVLDYKSDNNKSLAIRQHRDHLKNKYCDNKDHFGILRIQDHKNLSSMKDIQKLVNHTLDKKLVPLIHKYSNGQQQLNLF